METNIPTEIWKIIIQKLDTNSQIKVKHVNKMFNNVKMYDEYFKLSFLQLLRQFDTFEPIIRNVDKVSLAIYGASTYQNKYAPFILRLYKNLKSNEKVLTMNTKYDHSCKSIKIKNISSLFILEYLFEEPNEIDLCLEYTCGSGLRIKTSEKNNSWKLRNNILSKNLMSIIKYF